MTNPFRTSSTTALSICIPTYNFGQFIGRTLDSILPQISAEVELIVLDGGSTDNTFDEVAVRQRDCPQLSYYQQGFRGGIDRDIEKAISLAQGKYCWLFSADDLMLPGAIEKVLAAIQSNYDVYLCEHVLCSLEMQPIREHPPFNKMSHPRLFNLGDASHREEYFRSARTSEAFFSFLSGPIFKKEIWDGATNIPESFRNSCWIVAGHLLSMIPRGITLYYLNEILIHKRGDNDSFVEKGMVNRYAIAINGYRKIANTIFGYDSLEAFHIRRSICNDLTIKHLLNVKLDCVNGRLHEDKIALDRLAAIHYSDPQLSNSINLLIYNITPMFVYRHVKILKKHLKKWSINGQR